MLAVVPAAGLGTRMAALTGGGPKELLTVGGYTVLDRIIIECLDAGATRVRVVGSPSKPQIRDHVLNFGDPRLEYASQDEALGLADAVRVGAEPNQPTLVPMADTFFDEFSPLRDMVRSLVDGAWAAVAVRKVPQERLPSYGVVGFGADGKVDRMVEKPSPLDAPSDFAIASRFALSKEAASALFELAARRPVAGLSLTDLLDEGIRAGRRVDAVFLPESAHMYDCGDPDGYRAALEVFGP